MLLFTFNLIAIIIKFIIKGQSTMDYFIMTIFTKKISQKKENENSKDNTNIIKKKKKSKSKKK